MDDFVEEHGFCRALASASSASVVFEPRILAPQWHVGEDTRDAAMLSLSSAYLRGAWSEAWTHAQRLGAVLAPGSEWIDAVRAMRRDEAEASMLCALAAGERAAARECLAFLEMMRRSDGHTAALLSSVRSQLDAAVV